MHKLKHVSSLEKARNPDLGKNLHTHMTFSSGMKMVMVLEKVLMMHCMSFKKKQLTSRWLRLKVMRFVVPFDVCGSKYVMLVSSNDTPPTSSRWNECGHRKL